MQWKSILAVISCFKGLRSSTHPTKDLGHGPIEAIIPIGSRILSATQQRNKKDYEQYFTSQLSSLNIVKTTTHANGLVIDWVPIDSQVQGKVATPPPIHTLPKSDSARPTFRPYTKLGLDDAEKGPAGTVPIPRQNMTLLDLNRSLAQYVSKSAPPKSNPGLNSRSTSAAQAHWYASTGQSVANHGGSGSLSIYKTYVQSSGDFSLLQTAVIKYNVPTVSMQTVEAGWINYPAQGSLPHLFTYYTTNAYTAQGNSVGGWNRDQVGWVQYDSTIFPGTSFSPLSVDGGGQTEISVRYLLSGGNWWLMVQGRWIGYYPASLFSAKAPSTPAQTLAQGADTIDFYGETYQNEVSTTTTDMGSGEWPETGFGKSAYIRNMVYTNTAGTDITYNGAGGQVVSDTARYRLVTKYNSGTTWGSYIYLGGPGAGGVVGG